MNSFLQIKNLTKEFTSNNERHTVFKDVNLELNEGEFLCILGSSGCGKTTFLRSIGGFESPNSGEILINGKPILKPGIQSSMVFQTFDQLFPWKTVLGNIVYPLHVNKLAKDKKEETEIALEYLNMVGLTKFQNYYPHQLSGGMKQRVAIARSLAQKPSIILMDEPFASVDADTRTTLQNELIKIWSESNISIIFVTHSIIEAIGLSSKILVMGDSTQSVKLFIDNPVEMRQGTVRNPEDAGFSDCWSMLSNLIRK